MNDFPKLKNNICNDCIKEDVCQYKDTIKSFSKIVDSNKPPFLNVKISCEKYSGVESRIKSVFLGDGRK